MNLLRRIFITLVVLAAAAGFHVTTSVADPHGSVTLAVSGGTVWNTPDGIKRRFSFHGRQYTDGTVDGEWELVAGSAIMHGDVVCLTLVDSHTARLGGHVDQSLFSSFRPNTDIGWIATDLGEGVNAGDETTNLRAFRNAPVGSAEQFCLNGQLPFPGPDLAIDGIDHGNVQILHAP